jgi:hypothetical protein
VRRGGISCAGGLARNLLAASEVRTFATSSIAAALACSGCYSPIPHFEYPSAIEQEMAGAAIRGSVDGIELPEIDRQKAYVLRVTAPTGVDTALIRARLEERLAAAQVRLRAEPAPRGTPVLVAVVPFAGVDTEATLFGIPFVVPGLPVALGDISLYKSSTLMGRARVELSVWSAEHDELVKAPPSEASRYYRNVTVLTFVGPFRFSNLEEGPLPGDEP